MKRVLASIVAILLVGLAAAAVVAHEVTYKGTVVTVEPGKIIKVKVDVLNPETRKVAPMTFEIDDETKVLRGDVVVKFTDVKIDKGEQIAVTINNDDSLTLANVVRLQVRK
jgi:hypothetical protein